MADHQLLAKPRTVMGFDFGRVRIGVAIGQELTSLACPLATLQWQAQQPDWNAISELIQEWQPDLLVVGIPYHADGSPNAVTVAALRFSRQLQGRYRLTVETVDERLSSWEAEHCIQAEVFGRQPRHGRTTLDSAAAAIILETWFNQLKQSGSATCN